MAAPTYGTTNPRALEPWAIENTLAPLAYAGDRSQLQSELGSYQIARNTAEGQYGIQQAQQHEFAKQQLAQQLYEARLKEFPTIAKLPGGAQFMSQGGIPGMDMGGDPGALAGLAQAGNIAQGAENFMHAGAGFRDFSEGGWLQNPQQIPGMAGAEGVLTDNSRVRAELIKQQTSLANARMKGGNPNDPNATVSGPVSYDAAGNPINISYSKTPQSKIPDRVAYLQNLADQRQRARSGQPAPTGAVINPSADATSGSTTTPAAQPSGGTSGGTTTAQPAGSVPAGYVKLDTSSKLGSQLQGIAAQKVDKWAKDPKYKDVATAIRANQSNAGVYDIYQLPGGKHGVLTSSGAAVQLD